jgi:hypothetical protein
VSRRSHCRGYRVALEPDFQRLFHRELIVPEFQRTIDVSSDNAIWIYPRTLFSHPIDKVFSRPLSQLPARDDTIVAVEICHLYISPGHNFFGHHGREPDEYPVLEVAAIQCVAGHGIRGDRFFDYQEDYRGQITFFSFEVFEELCAALQLQDCSPALVRRNVITREINLAELIGKDFEVQGVRFHGTGECRPCYWMNRAIAPGAEDFLRGRGGLRARILTDGQLHSNAPVPAPT